jgi:hypothetical protein
MSTLELHTPAQTSRPPSGELAALEAVIDRGLRTFVEVGIALMRISEGRLYREAGFTSFGEYAERRWDISRAYAYRHIEAARVVRVLSPTGDGPLPANEAQARELARLAADPPQMRAVWAEALARSEGVVTARTLRACIAARRGRVDRPRLAPILPPATVRPHECPRCGFVWHHERGTSTMS